MAQVRYALQNETTTSGGGLYRCLDPECVMKNMLEDYLKIHANLTHKTDDWIISEVDPKPVT